MEFHYYLRSVYGNVLAYPANTIANEFASLLKVKSFNADQINAIAKLHAGTIKIMQVPDPKLTIGGK